MNDCTQPGSGDGEEGDGDGVPVRAHAPHDDGADSAQDEANDAERQGVAHGVVRREPGETDNRVRKVFLTDEGRAEFNRAWPAMHDAFEQMFEDIDDAEYSALLVTLQKMLKNIRKHDI